MSRAVLLPTPGDPFLIAEWMRNFKTYSQYVDALYVYVSWPQSADVVRVINDIVDHPKTYLVFSTGKHVDHGEALEHLIERVLEDVVMLAEDDCYIRHPERINEMFRQVEEDERVFVAPARGSMSQELVDAAALRGWGDQPAFWPHLFFIRTEYLRDTAHAVTLCAKNWLPGEVVLGLNHICHEYASADTLAAASFVLRAAELLPFQIPSGTGAHDQDPPWFHVGSLSTGPHPIYPEAPYPIDQARADPFGWAHRVSWWWHCYRRWGRPELQPELQRYGDAVRALRAACASAAVPQWEATHDRLVNW